MLYDARGVFNRSPKLMIGALALALGGCEAAATNDDGLPSAAESRAFTKLAELTLPNGNRVEFLAPNEASTLVMEHASKETPAITKSLEYSGLSALAIYRKLAPGADVPQTLLDAQNRIDQLLASRPAPTGEPTIEASGEARNTEFETVAQQLTASQFRAKYCQCGNWGEGNVCDTDVQGFRRMKTTDVHYFDGDVNAAGSDVQLTIYTKKWRSWDRSDYFIGEGQERFFHFQSGTFDWDIIADTNGWGYHFHAVTYNGLRKCR
jgi:hypothetical protein